MAKMVPKIVKRAGTLNRHLRYIISKCVFYILDICQLRLDFDAFDIAESTSGACTDSLTISGPTGRNPMDLCGTLTGLHGKFQ